MKRKRMISYLASFAVISLLATGCGKEIEVKNGSKVAVSMKGNKYTATEYYEKIKEDNISKLVDIMDKDLLSKLVKTTSEETDSINKQLKQVQDYYGSDEDNYNNILEQYFGVSSEKELKEKLSLEYKRNKAVEEYVKKHLSDNEIKKYYDDNIYGKVKASHILISIDAKKDASDEEKQEADKKAKETAEKVIKELNDGKKFESLAKKYSTDTTNASTGGDLGYFELDEMVEEFSNALKELKVKEYTKEPVKTEFGYHVILKTEEEEKPKLKTVKDDIKEKLTKQKLSENSSLYYEALKGIREENKIKWNDDILKSAYEKYVNNLIDQAKSNQ